MDTRRSLLGFKLLDTRSSEIRLHCKMESTRTSTISSRPSIGREHSQGSLTDRNSRGHHVPGAEPARVFFADHGKAQRCTLLGHDVKRVVVCPAAVVGEMIKHLDVQSAFEQVSNDGGLLETERIDRRECHRRSGCHIVRIDKAIHDAPVTGGWRAGAKAVNRHFMTIGRNHQAYQSTSLMIAVYPGSENGSRRNHKGSIGFGKP